MPAPIVSVAVAADVRTRCVPTSVATTPVNATPIAARSAALLAVFVPPLLFADVADNPGGGAGTATGTLRNAVAMKSIQIGTATPPPVILSRTDAPPMRPTMSTSDG